jgi:hypothetical protein
MAGTGPTPGTADERRTGRMQDRGGGGGSSNSPKARQSSPVGNGRADQSPPRASPRAPPREQQQQQQQHTPFLQGFKSDEEFYLLLRNRLDQLDYHLPFHPDSARLIQQLLADVIQTTETARTFKSQVDGTKGELLEAQERLQPLQHDLSRLTVENNQLHQHLIRLADERDTKEAEARGLTRQLEGQLSDLTFLAKQHALRAEQEQAFAEEAHRKGEEAFSKVAALHKLPKAQQKQVLQAAQPGQRLQLTHGLEPLDQMPSHLAPAFPVPDPVTLDMLKIAEARIAMLTRSNADMTHKNADLESQVRRVLGFV